MCHRLQHGNIQQGQTGTAGLSELEKLGPPSLALDVLRLAMPR